MSDRDIEKLADAYLVDPDDRPLDNARYDPLAADTADEHEPCDCWVCTEPDCLTCGDTRYVNTPAGYIVGVPAYRQEPCRDCNPSGPR